ncbi:hypothetical protein VPH35_089985 [Triticum aestivum]
MTEIIRSMYSASSRFINPKSTSQFHGPEKIRHLCTQQEKHGHEGGILSCGLANKEFTGFERLYVLKPKKRLFLQHALVLVHCSLYIFKGFFRVSPFSVAIVRKHALLHRTVRTISYLLVLNCLTVKQDLITRKYLYLPRLVKELDQLETYFTI